jgi:hypothetical protein
MGEKLPVKFGQTIRLPRNCWVLYHIEDRRRVFSSLAFFLYNFERQKTQICHAHGFYALNYTINKAKKKW